MWKSSVMLVPHGAAQRRRNMRCVKKFGQDSLQEDQIYLTIQSNRQKVKSKEIFSKNVGLNIDRGTLISCKWTKMQRIANDDF
ncbi:hypothetical protein TNCT_710051 [Trichonephila clavata]|uniref:Uncharacterized protein n=1 Tax=Trichonephila clavata TaxID=2740835 RepID=A0A8X6L9U6_TRICU|nr:hypothetical protein TNCT_710051 [Trichonephila clavata]